MNANTKKAATRLIGGALEKLLVSNYPVLGLGVILVIFSLISFALLTFVAAHAAETITIILLLVIFSIAVRY